MSLKFVIKEPKTKMLYTPDEFFQTLKYLFNTSEKRIVISTLYIGSGDLEKDLINSIITNKNIKNLKVDILIDKQRGLRPDGALNETSVDVLSKLLNGDGNDINISLFHNPLLGYILNKILPSRVKEVIGVMHMKIFICDDNIIISGANLSDSYLRNRQDRYLLIEHKLLSDSVHKIVNTIQDMSFTLNVDSTLQWESDLINPLKESYLFREQFFRRIQFIINEIQNDIVKYDLQQYHMDNTKTENQTTNNTDQKNEHNVSNTFCENENKKNENNKTVTSLNELINETTQSGEHVCTDKSASNGKVKNNGTRTSNEKNIYTNKNELHGTTTNHTNHTDPPTNSNGNCNFYFPLFENEKNVLTVELAIQAAFSVPPIRNEFSMIEELLQDIKTNNQSLIISTGYLNFPENFLKLFRYIYDNVTLKKGLIRFITTAPKTNSFYKSKGITYYVPLAYSFIAHSTIKYVTHNFVKVFKGVCQSKKFQKKVHDCTNIYLEYDKPSWTFHSKGMWLLGDINAQKSEENENDGKSEMTKNEKNYECLCENGKNYERSGKSDKNHERSGKSDKNHECLCEKKKNYERSGKSDKNNECLCENGKNYEYSKNTNFLKKDIPFMDVCSFNLSDCCVNGQNLCKNFLDRYAPSDTNNNQFYDNKDCDNNNYNEVYLDENGNYLPWGTVIGSSNYGYRSAYRDLEMTFIIKTNDYAVRKQFKQELNVLYESSNYVHMNELALRCPFWIRILVKFFKWVL
uniref:CDP-diacylglycerol--glycerol-3-phosphate 3-phosphatidyltransferase n=1 Tax=Piliocolobus tephrosceles TaxID=591936 RepID=A0A8C9GE15_9PRIM